MFSDVEPETGFFQYIDECERAVPHHAWEQFRPLDVGADLDHLARWLQSILETEPPPPAVNGLWFGISDPFVGASRRVIGYELYLCGSTHFSPADRVFDWAVDPEYMPERRYARSNIFHLLGTIASQHQMPSQLADNAVPLAYAGVVVNWLARREWKRIVGVGEFRAIAVGHDEGDGFLLGVADRNGYHPSDARATLEDLKRRIQRIGSES